MSGDARVQLQTAVVGALTTALVTAGGGGTPIPVLDHVPQDQAFPYVAYGDAEANDFDTTTEVGLDHRIELHVYTRDSRGKKAALEVLKKIYDALHAQPLTLGSGAACVLVQQIYSTAYSDPDGLTYHGIARFQALTTEA